MRPFAHARSREPWLCRDTHILEVRMNIGEIVREVEVMPVDEPTVPEHEPAHEEPVREPQPA